MEVKVKRNAPQWTFIVTTFSLIRKKKKEENLQFNLG